MGKAVIIDVKESASDLKVLYSKAPVHLRPRYKMLLLTIAGQSSSKELAAKTGVSRNSIATWKRSYSEGGINQLISDQRGGDFKSDISADDKKKIEKKLSDPKKAFTSFGEAQLWLKEELGIDKKYHAVNKYLKRNFGAKLKVGRKSHVKRTKRLLPFLKNLPGKLEHIKVNKFLKSECQTINLYAQDESRFGLLSIQRRCLTAKGIKPITPYQHRFKNFYLFGAYSPIDGDQFTLEFPYCNGDCFEQYLADLSAHRPTEFKILILDNGAFHKAKDLIIPDNIELLFLPPYSPELNPAERMWRHFKDKLANIIFDSLEKLSDKVCELVKQLMPETTLSITGWELYKNCLN